VPSKEPVSTKPEPPPAQPPSAQPKRPRFSGLLGR
jgi:hypothetical protein